MKKSKLPHEIFEQLESVTSVSARVKILQENESFELKTILAGAFNPDIKLDLPAGIPPYIPDKGPAGAQPTPLKKAISSIGKCVKGSNLGEFSAVRKEKYFIGLLESVHEKDAEILIAMKDKKLSTLYPTVTASLVRKAFPTLLPAK
jgi:hypothetical protein